MVDTRFYDYAGPFSLGELLAGLDAEILDTKFQDEQISGAHTLANSQPGDITFLGSSKHKDQAKSSRATACFVEEKLASSIGERHIIPIVSAAPRAHFARVLGQMYKPRMLANQSGGAKIAKSARVHTSVIMGAGAIIGENVDIGPYTVIGPGVTIGAGSVIESHCNISFTHMGENCTIKSNATIGGQGFGIAADEHGTVHIPHIGRVIIGDNVLVGSQTCIDRGQLADTEIADDVKIDNLVQIAHNVRVGTGAMLAGHVGIPGSVTIGKGVIMGGQVGVADHLTIGDGAVLIARSGVMHNVPAGETWGGAPAMPIRNFMRMTSAIRKMGDKPKRKDS